VLEVAIVVSPYPERRDVIRRKGEGVNPHLLSAFG